MPPFRNPFGKKPPVVNGALVQDENVRPSLGVAGDQASQKSSYAGSRASSSKSITGRKEEPSEYKLSGREPSMKPLNAANQDVTVVNDSGVYLPVSFSQVHAENKG